MLSASMTSEDSAQPAVSKRSCEWGVVPDKGKIAIVLDCKGGSTWHESLVAKLRHENAPFFFSDIFQNGTSILAR